MSDLGATWFKPFYKGSMKCPATKEEWTYDKGVIKCIFGPWGAAGEFSWNGSELTNKNETIGKGVFDGNAFHFIFPGHKSAFFSCLIEKTDDGYKWKTSQIKWKSGPIWIHDTKERTFKLEDGSATDAPEGQTKEWEVLAEVPPPVALFIAMYGRAQKLLEEKTEYENRAYTRCGILVMKTVDAYLCLRCSEKKDMCVCCDATSDNHPATQCKQCSVKGRFTCVRCGDKVGKLRVKGTLCDTHGLGSRAKECCRMNYKDHPMI